MRPPDFNNCLVPSKKRRCEPGLDAAIIYTDQIAREWETILSNINFQISTDTKIVNDIYARCTGSFDSIVRCKNNKLDWDKCFRWSEYVRRFKCNLTDLVKLYRGETTEDTRPNKHLNERSGDKSKRHKKEKITKRLKRLLFIGYK